MKNNKSSNSKLFINIVLVFAFVMVSTIVSAQAAPPPVPPVPPTGVPFGAIEILLVGLAGYGAKKYRDSKK